MSHHDHPGRGGVQDAAGWTAIHTVFAVWLLALSLLTLVVHDPSEAVRAPRPQTTEHAQAAPVPSAAPTPDPPPPATLPGGRTTIFGGQMLVAYYGVPGSGVLGVLGQQPPLRIWPRLLRAAIAFSAPGRRIQPVFEVIVSLARGAPGPDGDYSTDVPRSALEPYISAAHRLGALVVLDLQTGRSDFLTVARRWAWALRDPWVGLAVDPEWRVFGNQRPGQVIGHVGAAEVNRVSAWLSGFTKRHHLPQKVFMIHQFRTAMVRDPELIEDRPNLAMVQHVDGFGTPREKLATYHAVARPQQFHEGLKLFYRADTRMLSPQDVLRIRPRVVFVSYQ